MTRSRRAGGASLKALAAGVCAAVALAAGAGTARAYVRSLTPAGKPYFWDRTSVALRGYPQEMPTMTPEQIAAAALGATVVWTKRDPTLASCTYLDLDMSMATLEDERPDPKNDHVNNLIFHHTSWCPPGVTNIDDCYDAAALALTSVTSVIKTGEIVDADIEVNALNYTWGDITSMPATGTHDLQNALTHEMGHFIGLDHTCWNGDTSRPRPVDNTGMEIVECARAPQAIRETTMFASAAPGDVSKRTLAPDDQLAVCEIYAVGHEPGDGGGGDGGGGCIVAAGGAGLPARSAVIALASLAAAAAFVRRHRRR